MLAEQVESLWLVVPGLFAPPEPLDGTPLPRLPALERLLHRARPLAAEPDAQRQLLVLSGLAPATGIAPLCLLGENEDPGDWAWLRASPVHLRADLANLMLLGPESLPIEPEESNALVSSFNTHFAERGMCLVAPHPRRWYLRLARLPALQTTPIETVSGRSPEPFLPSGSDARTWQALLTEVQMLFHGHPINRARQQAGRLTINGLWLDGAGTLPSRPPIVAGLASLVGTDPFVQGLARLLAVPVSGDGGEPAAGQLRLVTDLISAVDLSGWLAALAELDGWLEQALRWQRQAPGRQVQLFDANGRGFVLENRRDWRFWRRPRPFARYL